MKKLIGFATPLMAVALMSGTPFAALAQNTPAAKSADQAQDWSTPPAGTEQEQSAYRDGVQGAKLDQTAKRKIDATSSYLYVHPPVKKADRDAYRAHFVAGYNAVVQHGSGS
jgi:hypothetical protein